MSRDAEAKPDSKGARLFDKRTVERNIKKGLISRKDYEKYLKGLEDIADKGVLGGPAEEPDDDEDDLDAVDDAAEEPAATDGNSHS
jgi:hypothetical protein